MGMTVLCGLRDPGGMFLGERAAEGPVAPVSTALPRMDPGRRAGAARIGDAQAVRFMRRSCEAQRVADYGGRAWQTIGCTLLWSPDVLTRS